jgi:hypothetical protein
MTDHSNRGDSSLAGLMIQCQVSECLWRKPRSNGPTPTWNPVDRDNQREGGLRGGEGTGTGGRRVSLSEME